MPSIETVPARRAIRLQKACDPSPEGVRSVSRRRAIRLPKACDPSPEGVRSVSRRRAAHLLIGAARKSASTVSRPAFAGRRSPGGLLVRLGFPGTPGQAVRLARHEAFGGVGFSVHEPERELTG